MINNSMAEGTSRICDWREQKDHQAQHTGRHPLMTHLTANYFSCWYKLVDRTGRFGACLLIIPCRSVGNLPASDD